MELPWPHGGTSHMSNIIHLRGSIQKAKQPMKARLVSKRNHFVYCKRDNLSLVSILRGLLSASFLITQLDKIVKGPSYCLKQNSGTLFQAYLSNAVFYIQSCFLTSLYKRNLLSLTAIISQLLEARSA